jgi:hypothetical protein
VAKAIFGCLWFSKLKLTAIDVSFKQLSNRIIFSKLISLKLIIAAFQNCRWLQPTRKKSPKKGL